MGTRSANFYHYFIQPAYVDHGHFRHGGILGQKLADLIAEAELPEPTEAHSVAASPDKLHTRNMSMHPPLESSSGGAETQGIDPAARILIDCQRTRVIRITVAFSLGESGGQGTRLIPW
jgi:hypothetical protein